MLSTLSRADSIHPLYPRFRIKESLRRKFADLANSCEKSLQAITLDLAAVGGPLESQLEAIRGLIQRISCLRAETLPSILSAETDCEAANIEESDYTVYTYEDLEFESGLVRDAVNKKKAFVENQVRCLVLSHSVD